MRRRIGQAIEHHSKWAVPLIGLITAMLGLITALSRDEVNDVTKEREVVQSRATDLRSQQVDLEAEIERLQGENSDLRARLDNGSGGSVNGDAGADDPAYRRLTVRLPPDGDDANLLLDRGEVTAECCSFDLAYSRNDDTGIPEMTAGSVAYSTDVPSAAATQEECAQAVRTSPTITPVRKLRLGTLICVITEGGTSLLRISATPTKNGTLRISQTFWPDPEG